MKYAKKWASLFLASAVTLSAVSIPQQEVQAAEVKKPTNVIMLVMEVVITL